jgi:geranylgeranyl pyrophosphate synthase
MPSWWTNPSTDKYLLKGSAGIFKKTCGPTPLKSPLRPHANFHKLLADPKSPVYPYFMSATLLPFTEPQNLDLPMVLERIMQAVELKSLNEDDSALEACHYHFAKPGKCMRARLCLLVGEALELERESNHYLAATVEALHNASLILDDLQDRALTRRGQPSVCALYGTDVALALTLRLTTASFQCLGRSESRDFAQLSSQTHEVVSETAIGQTRDLDEKDKPEVSELKTIAALKSGPLFGLALSLPLISAGYHDCIAQARKLASCFGLGYQILDDIKDRSADRLRKGDANIVNALEDEFGPKEALRIARDESHALLAEAKDLASSLPKTSGAAVVDVIRRLEKDVV